MSKFSTGCRFISMLIYAYIYIVQVASGTGHLTTKKNQLTGQNTYFLRGNITILRDRREPN